MRVLLHRKFNKKQFVDYISKGDEERREIYEQELDILIKESLDTINPIGYFVEKEVDNTKYLYCLATLGEEVEKKINNYFNENEYLKGYYLNSLSDWILYNSTDELYTIIKERYDYTNISERYNLNTEEEIKLQETIVNLINKECNANIKVTSNYMLKPLKTLAYYYKIGANVEKSSIDHSCKNCSNSDCNDKKIDIIIKNENNKIIQCEKGSNLLAVLQKNGVNINANCNGKKSCGKCKVRILQYENAFVPITKTEQNLLSIIDLQNNIRLACCQKVEENISIETFEVNDLENIIVEYDEQLLKIDNYYIKNKYSIAIDIGTTTIAMSLIYLKDNQIIASHKYTNPQTIFGSDIISRIEYAMEDISNMLTKIIRESLDLKIKALIKNNGVSIDLIESIIISGNTTMDYFLLNKSTKPLARSPYKTEETDILYLEYQEVFVRELSNTKVIIFPWVSAFIGGDIVSGLYYSNLIEKKGNILFIDIGTNGEIALKIDKKIYVTATAAGPAFEGANIKCGIGSINGSIYKVDKIDNMYNYCTIGEISPIGICGTGLIDLVACLIDDNKIDKNGKLIDVNKHFIYKTKDVEIMLYQEDIRQLQLAKSAILTGIEMLCYKNNITYSQIDELYVAGGFGSYLNIENAIKIGLLPKELNNKTKVVGNSSLGGAVKYSYDIQGIEKIRDIINKIETIDLNSIDGFNNTFVKNMEF